MKKAQSLKVFGMFLLGYASYSQVGIGTISPNPSAKLDIVSNQKGILIPRVALTGITDQTTIIDGNVESLLVYNTTNNTDLVSGYYYWVGGFWKKLALSEEIKKGTDNIVVWDPINNNFTYVDENGVTHVINLSDLINYTDTNTTNSSFAVNGTNLELTDSDNKTLTVPLASIDTDTNTINSSFAVNGTNLELTDSDNKTLTVPLASIDTDTNTINSSFAVNGTNLELTDSDNKTLTVPLASIDTNTINSSFEVNGTNLELTDSDNKTLTVPLSSIDTNTINSSFEVNGTNLELTDSDNNTLTVPLANIDTNTINSSFAVSGTNLELTDSDNKTLTVPLTSIATRAENGVNLNPTTSKIELGGALTKPTSIITDVTSTLAIEGLQSGNITNHLVTVDAFSGVLKAIEVPNLKAAIDTDNQKITEFSITAGTLNTTIEDGNTVAVNLVSTDSNNVLRAGSDGALYVPTPVDTDTNTINSSFKVNNENLELTDSTDNTLSVSMLSIATKAENGVNLNTSTSKIELGGALTKPTSIITNATNALAIEGLQSGDLANNLVSVDTSSGVLKAIEIPNLKAAIDTDNQTITDLSIATGILSTTIEDGNNATVNLVSTEAANVLRAGADGALYVPTPIDTDNQTITDLSIATGILSTTIEDGNTETLNLVSTEAANVLRAGADGALYVPTPVDIDTDNQTITDLSIATGILSTTIEDGNTETLNLVSTEAANVLRAGADGALYVPTPVDTDNQTITDLSIATGILSTTIEDGNTETLNLVSTEAANVLRAGADGALYVPTPVDIDTDNQTITDLSIATGILSTTIEDGNTETLNLVSTEAANVLRAGADGALYVPTPVDIDTDNQTITDLSIATGILSTTIEDGNTETLNLVSTEAANVLRAGADGALYVPTPVDIDTDNQTITDLSIATGILSTTIEDGNTETLNLVSTEAANVLRAGADGALYVPTPVDTDNQTITDLSIATGILSTTIEDGNTETLNLVSTEAANVLRAGADGALYVPTPVDIDTDNQTITDLSIATGILSTTIEDGNTETLNLVSTEAANVLRAGADGALYVPTPVDIDTDNQTITDLSIATGILSTTIEDGNTETLNLVSTEAANVLRAGADGALYVPTPVDTDNQTITDLSIATGILSTTIEDGNTETLNLVSTEAANVLRAGADGALYVPTPVDIDTDNQTITDLSIATGILSTTIEDGNTETLNLVSTEAANVLRAGADGALYVPTPVDIDTDNQTITDLSIATGILSTTIEDGNTETLNLVSTEAANVLRAGADGALYVPTPIDIDTDNQTITDLSIATGILSTTIEDGNTETLNLVSTEAANVLRAGADGALYVPTPVDIDTDNQTITDLSIATGILSTTIEDGNTETLNLVSTEAANVLRAGADGALYVPTPVDIDTDNQTITDLSIATGILSTTIEDGNTETLNLVSTEAANVLRAGADGALYVPTPVDTDNQTITDLSIATGILSTTIEDGNTETLNLVSTEAANVLRAGADGALYVPVQPTEVDYSTAEQLTGKKWINGAAIYWKTVTHTLLSDSASFDIGAVAGFTATRVLNIQVINITTNAIVTDIKGYDLATNIFVTGSGINSFVQPAGDYYVIIEYLK